MAEGTVIPIRVNVRVRPRNRREINENAQLCVTTYDQQSQITCNGKVFAYDAVFDSSTTQDDVFQQSAVCLIEKLFKGYNCTVLAYGQTGSGKTYTMGTEETTQTLQSEQRGIVPRIVELIFEEINKSSDSMLFTVSVSMLEVYDDKVHDLLCRSVLNREALPIREKDGCIFVQGLTHNVVSDLTTTMAEMERGCAHRSKGQTAMNESSSRSHAVFTVCIERSTNNEYDTPFKSKLQLVDLAGSERLKKTLAEGERKKEGIKINEGLHALGKVIQALAAEEKHVPYRDSKITRLLQDSLGGNSYTVMIACVSPADTNAEETLSTLRYADRVKSIKNKPKVNLDPQAALIQRLREENAHLRRELAAVTAGVVAEEEEGRSEVATGLAPIPASFTPSALNRTISAVPSPMRAAAYRDMKREVSKQQEQMKNLENKLATVLLREAMMSSECAKTQRENERLELMVSNIKMEIEKDDAAVDSIIEEVKKILKEEDAEMTELTDATSLYFTSADGEDEEDSAERIASEIKLTMEQSEKLGAEMAEIFHSLENKQKDLQAEKRSQQAMLSHEIELVTLREKLNALEKEKQSLEKQLKTSNNASKIAEERRKRLQELEKEVNEAKKKMREFDKLSKLKAQHETAIKRLNAEILEMKKARIRVGKQQKETFDKMKMIKMRQEKEITQLQLKTRKRDAAQSKKLRASEQQAAVFRRRYEEAVASNKQLKCQLMRSRSGKVNKNLTSEQIRNQIMDELMLAVSKYETAMNCEALKEQRTALTKRLKAKKSQRTRKSHRRSEMLDGIPHGEQGATLAELDKEVAELEAQIVLINTELCDMQVNCGRVDDDYITADTRFKDIDMSKEGQATLTFLFEEALETRKALVEKKRELDEMEEKWRAEQEERQNDAMSAEKRIEETNRSLREFRDRLTSDKNELQKKFTTLLESVMERADDEVQVSKLAEICDKFNNFSKNCDKDKLPPAPPRKKKTSSAKSTSSSSSVFVSTVPAGSMMTTRSKSSSVLPSAPVVLADDSFEEAKKEQEKRNSRKPDTFADLRNTLSSVQGEDEDSDNDLRDRTFVCQTACSRSRQASAEPVKGAQPLMPSSNTSRTNFLPNISPIPLNPPSGRLHSTSMTQKSFSPKERRRATSFDFPRAASVAVEDEPDENMPNEEQETAFMEMSSEREKCEQEKMDPPSLLSTTFSVPKMDPQLGPLT